MPFASPPVVPLAGLGRVEAISAPRLHLWRRWPSSMACFVALLGGLVAYHFRLLGFPRRAAKGLGLPGCWVWGCSAEAFKKRAC